MKKVLYIINSYPQLSQTYIQVEMNALLDNGYDLRIIALRKPSFPASNHLPYEIISDVNEIIEYSKQYQPNIIHTHWIFSNLPVIFKVAKTLNIPYTVRSHSFDVLWRENPLKKRIKFYIKNIKYTKIINDPLCKAVLAFPFTRDILIKSGIKAEKIVEVYPVVDYNKFYNREKNGTDIINMGAAIAKKGFKNYMLLAKKCPEINFRLFPIGYDKTVVKQQNKELGMPIEIHDEVAFNTMPKEYKKSGWLVYTSSDKYIKVGWPLSALEAMASGTGVCLPNIRSDMKDYIGDAGIIYSDIDELKEIITQPVPDDMREKGFELAKKYEIRKQIHLLTDLW